MRDILEENPIEVEAKQAGLNYVDLDGTVGQAGNELDLLWQRWI
jgi:succinyl-CoA synthetase beta subunit